ncbi:MAG: DUF1822 family protein [Oscillatoriales cyanobacterium]|uniref:DUF1822 family protein n=1 Tax=Microcoleus anatoxicus TaxID=2705319 RepID=UPI002970B3DE|nr:MAG: DUF1822 family protein [Oscillatoriales cyanobacterium]TAF04595.1 MAG: DUF1822 family protein [Oscillatoriales cyanobacterium]TAF46910.1 MAG: DUF1822 family protein [Oscillatoriales cyanobacterium]TAF64231.1 MAG: DUF1822 family protein [Oscillatoriales cyanobacterium]
MSDFASDFAKALEEFYKSKNFESAYELAKISHLSKSYFSKMTEKTILNPNETTIKKLASAFSKRNETDKENERKEIEMFFDKWRDISDMEHQKFSQSIQSWNLNLEVTVDDLSDFQENLLPEIMAKLENVGRGMIIVKYVKKGSIILGLESSDDSYERIRECYQRGELSELLGFTVSDLQPQVSLSQWFDNTFTTGWQTVEELLTPQQLRPAFFTESIQRGKRIDLQIDLITHTVNLVMTLTREDADNIIVNLKVFPTSESPNLPPNLKLILLTEGEIFKEVTSRSADQYIQYEFEAEPGDEFVVNLVLDEAEIAEDFVV